MTIYKNTFKDPSRKKKIVITLFVAIIVGIVAGFLEKNIVIGAIWCAALFIFITGYRFMKVKVDEYAKIKKMENSFPDFLQLMSSNLRAGMTTDRALLLSARKEFYPLDQEIIKLGKELMTGKDIEKALIDMAIRTRSQKIRRTISLIVSGLRSGGDIAILLEETAANTREREFTQKRAASNVLMYVIFIFAALIVGAPGLFGLSSVLVEILKNVLSGLPDVQSTSNLPFTLASIDISTQFIVYFSLLFIWAIGIIGSLVLGLVTKGEEREGVRYIIPILAVSTIIFFTIRIVLLKYFANFFDLT